MPNSYSSCSSLSERLNKKRGAKKQLSCTQIVQNSEVFSRNLSHGFDLIFGSGDNADSFLCEQY